MNQARIAERLAMEVGSRPRHAKVDYRVTRGGVRLTVLVAMDDFMVKEFRTLVNKFVKAVSDALEESAMEMAEYQFKNIQVSPLRAGDVWVQATRGGMAFVLYPFLAYNDEDVAEGTPFVYDIFSKAFKKQGVSV